MTLLTGITDSQFEYSLELPRHDLCVHFRVCPPDRAIQERRTIDASEATLLSKFLLDTHTGSYDCVGFQAMERGNCD